ncbi:hypothetical protein STCU_05778 [Strigomonas culicis]|uniref:Uncharacterized protein n=1 Tax=Strigomonas culicis TaxID=28005 RepID=S9UF72_9TRYP|nr:hypothetical protein STCU_05778 [Strigomonas culicis]|eukprot:EPY27384.1 hypothetical protein STCU_05778 [Strigomonas culicis]
MGLHNVGFSAVTLAELYDYTNDYIHTRFHRTLEYNKACSADEFDEDEEAAQLLTPEELARLAHVHCEMATFNTEVLDPDEQDCIMGMGEHPPIPTLAQFRKELVDHGTQSDSLYIFNFDPYIVEESELRLRSNMAETEEESEAIMASARHTKSTKGSFGILLNFNVVQRTITFAVPHLTAEEYPSPATESEEAQQLLERYHSVINNTVLEEHTVSMQTLYDALKKRDEYSLLSRGFVRVFINEDFAPKVAPIFPLFVVDGSSAGGLMTNLLDVNIAPHILGLAMLHHLTITFILSDSARRKQSSRNLLSKVNVCDVKLRGIPLTKIVQQLRLPLSMVVSESTSSSVATAFNWYYTFLQQLQVIQEVRVGLVLAERRGGAKDGQPNIFEEDFTAHLKMVVESESVMLIGFDVNVAQNVRISDRATPAHFAIVLGLDETRGIVRLADVNVKRFRKTWHIPLQRLYNATMGYGYMIASKEKKIIKALNDKEFQAYALKRACFGLSPAVNEINGRFEYPLRTYAVTVLADAVSRLGYRSDVERFLNFCGFHYTYFLSRHIPLQAAAFVLQNYSHYALDDELSIIVTHYDYYEGNEPAADADPANPHHTVHTMESLLEAISAAVAAPEETVMIVKYDHIMVQEDEAVWNGSNGSSFAIIVAFDPATQLVTLSDGNPNPFHRVWACPLSLLFRAICSWSAEDVRSRGTIHLVKQSQEHIYENTKGYDMAHCMVHHPFKPIFSSSCSCLALAATEMMLNIQVPQMLGGAPLAVEDADDKKRYMRYNNIFSSEDFLYSLPHFRVHDFQQEAHNAVDMVEVANHAFATLKLPLFAKSVTEQHVEVLQDPAAFIQACKGLSGLMTIVLVRYDTDKIHGIPGSSVGLVNRVLITGEDDDEDDGDGDEEGGAARPALEGAGRVQLLEGDPARWGIQSDLQAEVLMSATLSMVLIQEVDAQEEMFE